MNDGKETIGLYNPQTGKSQDFGSRDVFARPPVWIPSLNAAVYPDHVGLTPAAFSNNGQGPVIRPQSADFQRRILASRGDPTHVQTIVEDRVTVNYIGPSKFGAQFTVAASPDGSEIVYLDSVGRQLYRQKVVQGAFQSVPSPAFDATQWTYRPPDDSSALTTWYMTWRPNSQQVFLYNYFGRADGSSYTFLLDVPSGQVCELQLWTDDPNDWEKSWAGHVHWSPNGRYLAVVRTKGPRPIDFSDLIVLDTATGKLYRIEPTQLCPASLEKQGKHFVIDVAWAPDNRHLAAIGRVEYWSSSSREMQAKNKLYFVDFLSGQSVRVSSEELQRTMQWPHDDVLWSNDGSQLIVQAPRGLYLISVQKRVQP